MAEAGSVLVSRFSVLCAALATVTFTVGFCTPWWLQAPDLRAKAGLWAACVGDNCTLLLEKDYGDWLKASQSLSVAALITSWMTAGLVVIMVTAFRVSTSTNAKYGVIGTSVFTGVTIAVTLAIYGLLYHSVFPEASYSLGLSFYLVLAAAILFLALGLTLLAFSFTSRWRHVAKSPTT